MITKEEFLKNWDVKITEEGIMFPKDTCFVFLASEYCNSLKLDIDNKERESIQNFGYWLEGMFEVCDGAKGRSNYNCQDKNLGEINYVK